MRYLLDTSVVSSPISKRPNPRIIARLDRHGHECAIAARVRISPQPSSEPGDLPPPHLFYHVRNAVLRGLHPSSCAPPTLLHRLLRVPRPIERPTVCVRSVPVR